MKPKNEVSIGEALRQMIEQYKLQPKLHELKIVQSWEKIMGRTVSSRTKELYVRNERLYVLVNSSVLKNELVFSKEKILKMVNEEIGQEFIREVVLL